MSQITKTTYQLPIGPIHPALKEPVMFKFEIDGEKIVDVDVELGHVHRAIEWTGMSTKPYTNNLSCRAHLWNLFICASYGILSCC